MSRLQDELARRQGPRTVPQIEAEIRQRFEARKNSLARLAKNKDFQAYLKLEEEMNDPRIVIAKDCSDPICMSLKRKVRDFWNRQKVLENVTDERTDLESRRASR